MADSGRLPHSYVNCERPLGLGIQQLWLSSENMATEKYVQGGCYKFVVKHKIAPKKRVQTFSSAVRKMEMPFSEE
jgi:hypothetical protein